MNIKQEYEYKKGIWINSGVWTLCSKNIIYRILKIKESEKNVGDTLGFVNAVMNNREFLYNVQIFKRLGKIALKHIDQMSVPESVNQRVFNFNSPRERVECLAEVAELQVEWRALEQFKTPLIWLALTSLHGILLHWL